MVRRYYGLPPLTALAVFEATARHASVRLAARELNVTPSAVSRQIKVREDELGVKLFLRERNGIALTAAAQDLFAVLASSFANCGDVVRALWDACERAGLPSRYKGTSSFQFRAVRTALIDGHTSYTMSGAPAVERALSNKLPQGGIGSLLLYHDPSTWNHFLKDHAISFRMTPLSVDETLLTAKWLVHKEAVEGVDYDLADLTHVWIETNDQDRRVVEENARGVRSPAYEPGPYSEMYEDAVVRFVDWYAGVMEPRLGGGERTGLRDVA